MQSMYETQLECLHCGIVGFDAAERVVNRDCELAF